MDTWILDAGIMLLLLFILHSVAPGTLKCTVEVIMSLCVTYSPLISLYRFQKHIDGTSELPSDLKSAVFNMAMANGDETTFDQLVKVHVHGGVL